MSTDVDRIREVVEDLVPAMHDRDAKRIVARYAPEIVTYTLAPPLRNDGPEVRDPSGLEAWFGGFDGPIGYEIRDLNITADGDHSELMRTVPAYAEVLARGEEEWQSAHAPKSPPSVRIRADYDGADPDRTPWEVR